MVRKNAAWALGNIADKRAVPGLTESLTDTDGEVRSAAQAALASLSGSGT
jgi:HEAT repeat protein